MKKLYILFLFISISSIFSQEQALKVSLSFENSSIKDVLDQIENITEFSAFYADNWFDNRKITGNYIDTELETILIEIFKDTLINFFITADKKIILTQNSIIYNELPAGFFGNLESKKEDGTINQITEINPVFYQQQKVSNNTETVRIGKENKNNSQKTFRLSGYAKNMRTGRPIPNMAITIKNTDIGTQTNKNGFYEIQLKAGENILETSSLGIKETRKRVIIYNNGQLDFTLDESLELLDEVILKADIDKNVKETISGVTNIDVEESKNIPLVLGERDALKVATALPGISTTGEGSAGFNVRGGKTDQNLILLDDAVIYNPQHFFGIFSALNPFALQNIDIYKGNIPSEYGGRLSSVFDIQTKNGDKDKFSGEASVGPITGNIVLETPIVREKSSLLIGGRGAYANWLIRSLDEESLQDSEASFYDVIGKYNHQINDNNKVNATAYFSRDDFSITSDSLYIYSNRSLSLKWDHKFNDKNRGKLILANSNYQFNIKFDGDTNDDFDLGFGVDETELKLKMDYLHSKKFKFEYGLSSKLYTLQPGSIEPLNSESIVDPLFIDKERGLESAAFFSGRFDLNKNISIDAGLRYSLYNALGKSSQKVFQEGQPRNESTVVEVLEFDTNEIIETYSNPEVRLSLRYLLGTDFSIKASYNNTAQYIHRLSNNTTISPIDTWKLSDLNIAPQKATQYALGFYKNLNDDIYELSIESFYKTSTNILDFKTGAEILLNENIETEVLQGDGMAYGVELLLKKNKGRLNGWLGYTYSRSFLKLDGDFNEERVNNGDFFPTNFDKPHDFSMVANYKFTKRFSLSANFVYQTGRPVTFPVGRFNFGGSEFVVFSDRNKFRIPDFYRLDLGFNIEGNHKIKKFAHSFWTISIYNVLGRNNPFSVFFVTENGEIKALKSSIFSIPIPSVTYNFKF
ncbi:carboxypeptidase-like regulatory domain-containing protein [Aquimarina sp. RZ0]|uniref:TonB-dependent receptor n=1 Tax=Aquimarina sp. RZ0 TaxID=2607730 RepID=UPI0011F33B81|nr:carboxypeptidase-like regulatory domain-containing protein [Aquimarina sp. RZ0]KAA1246783.1 TonB-dependent receptor [Aquimarina sp. RZ0]